MEGVQLKRKVTLRRKEKPAEFTFTGLLKVKLLWQSSTDLDLCMFFKKKDGEVGGVFSSAFRQKKSDLGSLTEFPFMLHKGDEAEPEAGGESVEQINVASLNDIDTAYVCVLNYSKAIDGEEINFTQDSGRVEIQSDNGDYFEVVIDSEEQGHVYNVCSIKNNNGENSVMNEGIVMDLGTAFDKIPGFSLICE
ncbi:hypothetical protein BWX39_05195 [Prevotella intermedia ATCC 25611 = DSM 20706]|uniref:hypothetical protein n=1 Tax=Prevotella intermedia TaxID=28131 RepID=UPI0003FFDA37|nr:hypothetical protein [Prevotella intermedia]APW32083.1 hypothetical protein BWX39_05195 [Prevotella intermedia ATCC 25611 = DSM 20706]SUB95035.1 Uncharacterized protein involved in stress response [Prevotella intermedia]